MSGKTHPPVNQDVNLRVFARVAEIMPKKLPELISSFATEGDVELLETVLKSGIIVTPVSDDDRLELLTSIFPVREAAADPERAAKLIRDWVELQGVKTDHRSLSTYLARLKWAVTAHGVLAMGADPNYGLSNGEDCRTPVARAIDNVRSTALRAMLDYLRQRGEVPLYSFKEDVRSGAREDVLSLFTRLLDGMRDSRWSSDMHIVEYLISNELPASWKKAIGDAVAKCNGAIGIGYEADGFDSFINLLSVAKFDDPAQWQIALSGYRYMANIVSNDSRAVTLGRIVQAAGEDGVDINSWVAPLRLNGVDYPGPLLAIAVHRGQADLVKQYLEMGADMDFCMPGEGDVPGQAYTGPTLLEYAEQNKVPDETRHILAAWRAQQTIERVTGRFKRSRGS